jgi:hypothetical protein
MGECPLHAPSSPRCRHGRGAGLRGKPGHRFRHPRPHHRRPEGSGLGAPDRRRRGATALRHRCGDRPPGRAVPEHRAARPRRFADIPRTPLRLRGRYHQGHPSRFGHGRIRSLRGGRPGGWKRVARRAPRHHRAVPSRPRGRSRGERRLPRRQRRSHVVGRSGPRHPQSLDPASGSRGPHVCSCSSSSCGGDPPGKRGARSTLCDRRLRAPKRRPGPDAGRPLHRRCPLSPRRTQGWARRTPPRPSHPRFRRGEAGRSRRGRAGIIDFRRRTQRLRVVRKPQRRGGRDPRHAGGLRGRGPWFRRLRLGGRWTQGPGSFREVHQHERRGSRGRSAGGAARRPRAGRRALRSGGPAPSRPHRVRRRDGASRRRARLPDPVLRGETRCSRICPRSARTASTSRRRW